MIWKSAAAAESCKNVRREGERFPAGMARLQFIQRIQAKCFFQYAIGAAFARAGFACVAFACVEQVLPTTSCPLPLTLPLLLTLLLCPPPRARCAPHYWPVPLALNISTDGFAESVTVIVAARVPTALGVNVTVTVQCGL